MNNKNRLFSSALLLGGVLLSSGPVQAGLFGSDPAPRPQTVSDKTIADIKTAFDDQRYLDAGRLLDQALLVSGEDPRLIYWSGEISLARGQYENAIATFKTVSNNASLAGPALEGEGIALAQLGRSDQALASLQAAVAKTPTAWRAWNALGSEFDRRHQWADAETAYGHALENSGNAAIVLNNRGFSRLSQHRLDEAVADFVSALQKKPDLTSARNNLRLAMAMRGEYDRAVAGAGSSDQASVLNNAGFAALLRGDYAAAEDLLQRAMKAKGEYYAVAAANLRLAQDMANGAKDGEHAPAH